MLDEAALLVGGGEIGHRVRVDELDERSIVAEQRKLVLIGVSAILASLHKIVAARLVCRPHAEPLKDADEHRAVARRVADETGAGVVLKAANARQRALPIFRLHSPTYKAGGEIAGDMRAQKRLAISCRLQRLIIEPHQLRRRVKVFGCNRDRICFDAKRQNALTIFGRLESEHVAGGFENFALLNGHKRVVEECRPHVDPHHIFVLRIRRTKLQNGG